VYDKVSAFLYICLNSSYEVSKEVSKTAHPFSKSSFEDLLKFFQKYFPKKFRKSTYFLWKTSLPNIFLKNFEKLAPDKLPHQTSNKPRAVCNWTRKWVNEWLQLYLRSVFICSIERVACRAFLCPLDTSLDKLVIDRLMDISTWPSTADLTHVEHDWLVRAFYCFIHYNTPNNYYTCHVTNTKLQLITNYDISTTDQATTTSLL